MMIINAEKFITPSSAELPANAVMTAKKGQLDLRLNTSHSKYFQFYCQSNGFCCGRYSLFIVIFLSFLLNYRNFDWFPTSFIIKYSRRVIISIMWTIVYRLNICLYYLALDINRFKGKIDFCLIEDSIIKCR